MLLQDTNPRPRKRHRFNLPVEAPVVTDPPPLPEIKAIHPSVGSIRGGEIVWICVHNLRRDQDIVIGFGEDRCVKVKYLSAESDISQLLECTTPKSDRPCGVHLSIHHFYQRDRVVPSHGKVPFEYIEETLDEMYVQRCWRCYGLQLEQQKQQKQQPPPLWQQQQQQPRQRRSDQLYSRILCNLIFM
jgi:hypothetical protein